MTTEATMPQWTEWVRLFGTPAIALAGLAIAGANLWLARKKRKDDLFDRRYCLLLDANRFLAMAYVKDGYTPAEPTSAERSAAELKARALLLFDTHFHRRFSEVLDRRSEPDVGNMDPALVELFRTRMV